MKTQLQQSLCCEQETQTQDQKGSLALSASHLLKFITLHTEGQIPPYVLVSQPSEAYIKLLANAHNPICPFFKMEANSGESELLINCKFLAYRTLKNPTTVDSGFLR